MNKIQEALLKLDTANDNHWTDDGLPRVDAVKFSAGIPTLTRDEITSASPGFSRTNAVIATEAAGAQAPQKTAPEAGTATAVIVAPAGAVQAAEQTGASDGQVHTEAEAEIAEDDGEQDVTLAELLVIAQGRVAQIEQYRVQVLSEHAKATAEVDRILNEIEATGAAETSQSAIQQYLAGQNRLLDERAEFAARLRDAKIDLKQLIPQAAPIDTSLRNRNRSQYRK